MDIEELKAELSKYKKTIDKLEAEKDSILNKNRELLSETKSAKKERNELKDKFSSLEQKFEELSNKSNHGDEVMEKVNELASKKIEKIQAEYDSKMDELSNKLFEYESNYNSLKQNYDSERISLAVRTAAEKSGVLPTAIDDVVNRASGIFSISEDGNLESRDSDGNLRKIGKKVLDPELFVIDLKEKAPHFWPASDNIDAKGNRTSGNTGKNPWAKDSINYTEQAKLMKSDPQKAEKLKAAAGA